MRGSSPRMTNPIALRAIRATLVHPQGLYRRAILPLGAQFEQLYADSEKQPRVLGIPLHPMIIGQPLRIKYLERVLAEIKKHERVRVATGTEIIDAYERAHPT